METCTKTQPHTFQKTYVRQVKKSSWVWRNIMEERDLPLCEAKCRVGNGNEISINHPNWFPTTKSNKRLCLQQIDKVPDLIDEEQKFWKFNLVFQLYSQEHAQQIHQILLCKTINALDQLIWPNSKTGQNNGKVCNDANPGQVIFIMGCVQLTSP